MLFEIGWWHCMCIGWDGKILRIRGGLDQCNFMHPLSI